MRYNLAGVVFTPYRVNYEDSVAMIGVGLRVFNPFDVDPSEMSPYHHGCSITDVRDGSLCTPPGAPVIQDGDR